MPTTRNSRHRAPKSQYNGEGWWAKLTCEGAKGFSSYGHAVYDEKRGKWVPRKKGTHECAAMCRNGELASRYCEDEDNIIAHRAGKKHKKSPLWRKDFHLCAFQPRGIPPRTLAEAQATFKANKAKYPRYRFYDDLNYQYLATKPYPMPRDPMCAYQCELGDKGYDESMCTPEELAKRVPGSSPPPFDEAQSYSWLGHP